MKKKILLFLLIALMSFYFFSCKKEIIEPTINHVNFSENIVQIDFDNKPSFELSYSKNNVINGEISLQLLDETGTILHILPNSNLLNESGKIRINNVYNLIDGEKYFLKIENYNYNNSYYSFTINNDTTYKDKLLIPFFVSIDKNIESIFIETFDLFTIDDFGPQNAIEYGARINNNDIIFNSINIYIYTNEKPWDFLDYIYIRDSNNLIITQKLLYLERSWIQHDDTTYQIYINNIWNLVKVGDFKQKIQFEVTNCITPKKMKIKIKNFYYNNYDHILSSFETNIDSIKIENPAKKN